MVAFEKVLSRNDTGENGSHQAGILVPKGDKDLLSFFPLLDPSIKNPDALVDCTDEDGRKWRFRYVYYNNRLHEPEGTRNEYRITHMTKYLRAVGATAGQAIVFKAMENKTYHISVPLCPVGKLGIVKLCGWRRVH